MPKHRLAFFVQHARELDPQLDFGGIKLETLKVNSDFARSEFVEELSPLAPETLEVNGYIPMVVVHVEAKDEDEALLKGFREAKLLLEPYSLLAPENKAIDFSRHRPTVLPHALLIDEDADPPTAYFRHQDGPRLARITVADESLTLVQNFNGRIVRRIAEVYPQTLLRAGAVRSPFAFRIARAVHWYSQAEGQEDPTLAFVCYWIALEALVLKSSRSPHKAQTLVSRMALLVKRHVWDSDWTSALQDLWEKRSDIVHEGFGATPTALIPEIGAGEVNPVRYLFFVVLLYALEQYDRAVPLEELWHPKYFDSYSPSVTIDAQQFPYVLDVLSLKRSRQRLGE